MGLRDRLPYRRFGDGVNLAFLLLLRRCWRDWRLPRPWASAGAPPWRDALGGPRPGERRDVPLAAGQCSGTFIAADLPHEIEVSSPRVFNYDSLGAGLAAGDLDNDGDIDLVLANLDGPTALLWNETAPGGALQFRRTDLTGADDSKPTSAIVAVDTDADGWLDLAVTHTNRPPTLWRNTPQRTDPAVPLVPGAASCATPTSAPVTSRT